MILFQSILKRMLSIFCVNREVKSEEIHSLNDAEQCLKKGESTVGKRVWQSGDLVSPTTTLNL